MINIIKVGMKGKRWRKVREKTNKCTTARERDEVFEQISSFSLTHSFRPQFPISYRYTLKSAHLLIKTNKKKVMPERDDGKHNAHVTYTLPGMIQDIPIVFSTSHFSLTHIFRVMFFFISFFSPSSGRNWSDWCATSTAAAKRAREC
jgi:hypothetical protein